MRNPGADKGAEQVVYETKADISTFYNVTMLTSTAKTFFFFGQKCNIPIRVHVLLEKCLWRSQWCFFSVGQDNALIASPVPPGNSSPVAEV